MFKTAFAPIVTLMLASSAWGAPADDVAPRVFPVPQVTDWAPQTCRSVPVRDPVLLPRTGFRRAHGDMESTDEISVALPPTIEREWIAESSFYAATAPAYDGAGNVYASPLLPHEKVILVSLDSSGARRFAVPGEPNDRAGGVVPLILHDPQSGGDVVYVNAYDRVVAVRASDGAILWDTPTGIDPLGTPEASSIGIAWVPNADAIVATTTDGFLVMLNRQNGEHMLDGAIQLPGGPSPAGTPLNPTLVAGTEAALAPLLDFSTGAGGVQQLLWVLLGFDSEVANNFSVDPRTNSLWIGATAPDGDDGQVDGVSEFGALYRFDVVPDGDEWKLEESCRRLFTGRSASTSTIVQSGTRVYLGGLRGQLDRDRGGRL